MGWAAALLMVGAARWCRRGEDRGGADAEAVAAAAAAGREVGAPTRASPTLPTPGGLGRAVAGAVRDEQGRAVADAQVCATAHSPLLASRDTREPTCARSGRDGRYRITGLLPTWQMVTAGAPGYVPAVWTSGSGAAQFGAVDLTRRTEVRDVDLVLEGGGVEIAGRVKDLSGGAVEGALISAGNGHARSDADGRFALWVRPGDTTVEASADGYAPGYDFGAAPGRAFEVFLTPEAVIVGTVVRPDGSPVEGARVTVLAGTSFSAEAAISDASGGFRLERLQPGAYKASAEADDAYGTAAAQVVLGLGETSPPQVITAYPAFLVEGRIVDDAGEVCALGGLSLEERASGRRYWGAIDGDTVRLRGVQPGEYTARPSCTGMVPAEAYPPVVVTTRSVTGLKWAVERGRAIRGVVVDAQGRGVPRATVEARPRAEPGQPPRARSTPGASRGTAADGRFEVAGLLPGSYELRVRAYAPTRATPTEPTTVRVDADVEGVRIELPATGEVRGRVRDERGRPVPKVRVAIASGTGSYWALAGDDGGYVLPLVGAGEYRLQATRDGQPLRAPGSGADDLQGVKIAVRAGATETVDLVVEAEVGRISGSVEAEGGPVVDAFIDAIRESDSAAAASGAAMRERWRSGSPILTDADGRFAVPGLAPGRYTVRAYRRGGGEAVAEHVEPGAEVRLTIAAPASLAGRVRGPGHAAPTQFWVQVRDERTGLFRSDNFFRTDGAWSFAELPAGRFKLQFIADEGTQTAEVELAAGEARTLEVELAPLATLRGTLVDLAGAPQVGWRVTARGAGRDDEPRRNVTDAAGRFEVRRVPGGAQALSITPADGDWRSTTLVPVHVEPGRAEVELPPVVVVRPRDAAAGIGELGYTLRAPEPGADPRARRLVVAVVRPGGPAAAAGLQAGDEILRVDGHDVTGPRAYLHTPLTLVPEGQGVTLGLARGAEVRVTAGPQP